MTPGFGDCRRAAARLRRAEHGRQAAAAARPRSVNGVLRTRAPLAVMLYLAAREERLVWRGPDSFALLEPPVGWPPPRRGRLLRWWDQHWQFLWYGGPPLLAVAGAGGTALLPLPAAGTVALILVLAALFQVTGLMVATVIVAVVRGVARLRRPEPERHPSAEAGWRIALLHHADGPTGARLLEQTFRQVVRLVNQRFDRVASDLGLVARPLPVAETLFCPLRTISTTAMRTLVERWPRQVGRPSDGPREAVVLLPTLHGPGRVRPVLDPGGLLAVYLLGLATVVPYLAWLIADDERTACTGTGCAGRPATFIDALCWLAWRMVFDDPPGLTPATGLARLFGVLVGALTVVGALVLATAIGHAWLRARYDRKREEPAMNAQKRPRLLVMVVTPEEHDAVREAVTGANDCRPVREFPGGHPVLLLGPVSGVDILLAQCEQGAVGSASATPVAADLIQEIRPDYLILVGICFGLKRPPQKLGDVLVSHQLRLLDHRRISDDPAGDGFTELQRGPSPEATSMLLAACRSAALLDWSGAPVHFGPMLTASALVDSTVYRERLISAHRDAIGGEMEAGGIYSVAARSRVDWIVIKGICDFAAGKNNRYHRRAARNAAEFLVHMVGTGALDRS
ncbi:5'-methylthioadenosine/S-adenosylhomocysteine nucleosidase family protein [Micromonospora echinofusca]|uniref:Nucleoside phosphorylase domain-containing protein n=1 Tax=Micromonospora echinofusca TaxID=47858 RepID=A0ABS3W054_MICEH|nr:hypothetical protein [Micromonospora echinofusca]MBO4210180.1 hypothetical protein [Micromonospora echinofusca]